jgi:hypothetical protein
MPSRSSKNLLLVLRKCELRLRACQLSQRRNKLCRCHIFLARSLDSFGTKSAICSTPLHRTDSVVQNDVEQRPMNPDATVVFNKAELAKAVHEEAHA